MSDSCNSTFILVTTKIYLNQGSNHLCYQIQRSLFGHQCLREHQYACDKYHKKHISVKNYFIFLIHYEGALDKALGKSTWEATEIKALSLFWLWASCVKWILICVFFCTNFWAVEKIKWFDRAVILSSLHPASLMHKNPQRHKIICGMRPVRSKDRLIDLKMFLKNVLFVWFLWLFLWLLFNDTNFFFSLLCLTIEGVHFYFSKLWYRVLESVFRIIVWLYKDPGLFFWIGTHEIFTRWVPGLTITICNKITDRDVHRQLGRRNPSAPNRSSTSELLVNSPDAFPLSYRRPVGAKAIKLQSATKSLRHCTQTGWLQGTKESIPLFPTLHSKLGCLLFSIGSSNSSTTLHGGDGGGKALHVFSRFEVRKGRFRQFDFFLTSITLYTTSILQDFQPSTHPQFSLTTSTMNVVGLIYTTRSVVKSWCILVVSKNNTIIVLSKSILKCQDAPLRRNVSTDLSPIVGSCDKHPHTAFSGLSSHESPMGFRIHPVGVQIKNGLPCSSNKKHKVVVTYPSTISFWNDFLSLIFIPRRLILKLNQIINISKK